jgi:hypothetical protein
MLRIRHVRRLSVPPEEVRPWIDQLWSGSDRDCFPRDLLPAWRQDPQGAAAWSPGQSRFGAGRFCFRLDGWDGRTFRAAIEGERLHGWHAFELEPYEGGTLLSHTLEFELRGATRLGWSLYLAPLHHWTVQAIFDRIVAAVRTGRVSPRTNRPLPLLQGALLRLRRWMRTKRLMA